MAALVVLLASTLLGALGWWLGAFIGLGTALTLSVAGTALGVYLGRKIAHEYLP